ncbi:hypothetical protein ACFFGT_07310 [Mucilaginibacter angelicae]|uniref:YD repeat-containing protein n=1 Tax=Mucilaginibacter angelicae TaxID=869718 RepID=A0ABV6L3E2_9SPHI
MKSTCKYFVIMLFVAAFTACKKDKPVKVPDPPVTPKVFSLKQVYQTNLESWYKSDSIFYTYDAQNRLTHISHIAYQFPAKTNIDFTYDGNHITSEVFDDGQNYQYTENYHYNARGLVTYIDHINKYAFLPNGTKVLNTEIEHTDTFTYDAQGRIVLMDRHYPDTGSSPQDLHYKTTYEYDAQGLLTKSVIYSNQDPLNYTYVTFAKFTDKLEFNAQALNYFLDFNMHPLVLAQLGRLPLSMRLYYSSDNLDHQGWEYDLVMTETRISHIHLTNKPTPARPFNFDYSLSYQ